MGGDDILGKDFDDDLDKFIMNQINTNFNKQNTDHDLNNPSNIISPVSDHEEFGDTISSTNINENHFYTTSPVQQTFASSTSSRPIYFPSTEQNKIIHSDNTNGIIY